MSHLTCEIAVRRASDHLSGLLTDEEAAELDGHLTDCEHCSCLLDQLRETVAVLGSRPGVEVPDTVRALVEATGDRGDALAGQLPRLYASARAIDDARADDLVQETIRRTLEDPTAAIDPVGLAATLARLATESSPQTTGATVPEPGTDPDPDADEAELFYPDFYTDGPDAGAWVDPVVAWGHVRVPSPGDDASFTELDGAVDAALARLDPLDRGLLTLVDIERAPDSRAALEFELSTTQARKRLGNARFAVRAALDRHITG